VRRSARCDSVVLVVTATFQFETVAYNFKIILLFFGMFLSAGIRIVSAVMMRELNDVRSERGLY
jgi:hypothetical protein